MNRLGRIGKAFRKADFWEGGGDNGGLGGHDGRSSLGGSRGTDNAPGGLGGDGRGGFGGSGGLGVDGMSLDQARSLVSNPGGFMNARADAQMAAVRAARPDTRQAFNDAWDYNSSLREAGLLSEAQEIGNQRAMFDGRIGDFEGPMAGALADKMTAAYSPRTTGLMSMVKNMFSESPKQVDTPYSALNSLISRGYAEPAEDGTGFKSTPRATWDAVKGFFGVNPLYGDEASLALGGVRSFISGDPTMGFAPSIPGIISGLISGYGTARQMDVAGVDQGERTARSGTQAGSSGGLLFDPETGYSLPSSTPSSPGLTIDPQAWFDSRRAG